MRNIIRSPLIAKETAKLSSRRPRQLGVDINEAKMIESPHFKRRKADHIAPSVAVEVPSVDELLAKARLSVLDQFKEEAEAAREMGRQRGLREGHLEGSEEARQSFIAELEHIRSIADQFQNTLENGLAGLEDMTVAIAFESMCRVLGDAAVSIDGIRAMVKQTTERVLRSEKLVVRLNPVDYSLLSDAKIFDTCVQSQNSVSWVSDSQVVLGGCMVDADGGSLDARLETQLENLKETLLLVRQNKSMPKSDQNR